MVRDANPRPTLLLRPSLGTRSARADDDRCETRKTASRRELFIHAMAIPTLWIIDEVNGELSDADSAGTTVAGRSHIARCSKGLP